MLHCIFLGGKKMRMIMNVFNTQRIFPSNIFSTRLLEPMSAGPTNTEGRLHLLQLEAAESMVIKTRS